MKITLIPISMLAAFAAQPAASLAADISAWRGDGNGLYPNVRTITDWTDESRIEVREVEEKAAPLERSSTAKKAGCGVTATTRRLRNASMS